MFLAERGGGAGSVASNPVVLRLGGAGRASLPSPAMRWGPSGAGGRIAARGSAQHRGSAAQTRRTVLCTASVEHALTKRSPKL